MHEFQTLISGSGFAGLSWQNLVMFAIGLVGLQIAMLGNTNRYS